jgi:hypothetical protein
MKQCVFAHSMLVHFLLTSTLLGFPTVSWRFYVRADCRQP